MHERILVTGGGGFIGSHMAAYLLARGVGVNVLDDFSSGSTSNLEGLDGDLRVFEGSIVNPKDVAAAIDGVDGIFHFAALPSVARSVQEPVLTQEVNVTGTVALLDAARCKGVKMVFAGSSSAYGDQDVVAKNEDLKDMPISPYAASKVAAEHYCRVFAKVYGLPVVITRFFNVYGPRQVPDNPYSGVVAAFCLALLEGRRPHIDGDGLQSRDFTYVEDIVRGCHAALETRLEGCPTINLACGGSHTVMDLLVNLQEYADNPLEPSFGPAREGDVRESCADIARARQLLGFEPETSFSEGLRRTFEWYRESYK